MTPHRAPLLFLLFAVSACQSPPPPELLSLNWLDDSIVVHGRVDDGILVGNDLVRAWNMGLAGSADEQGVVWALREEIALEFEFLTPAVRQLVIEAEAPEGRELRVELRLDGTLFDERVWSRRERLTLPLSNGPLESGIHRLEITTDPIEETRGLGFRAVGFERPSETQERSAERWRWSPITVGSKLEMAGTSRGPASLELLEDRGADGWTTLWSRTIAAGGEFSEIVALDSLSSLGMARLAVRTAGDGLQLDRLIQRVPVSERMERRNLVLLSMDTTRWDAIGAYRELDDGATDLGIDRSPTPRLDELAGRATVWSQALSPAPVTAPTHASLFLSSPPRTHGLDGNGRPLPRASTANFACYLEAWGYRNAGFISLGVLLGDLGFAQGFEKYSDELGSRWNRPADRVLDHFREWLSAEPAREGQPRFVWLHYSDPHMPYGQPESGGLLLRWDGKEEKRLNGTGRGRRFVFMGEPGRHRLRFESLPGARADREYKLLRFRLSDESIVWNFGDGFREGADVLMFRSGAEILVDLPVGGPPGIRLEVGVEDALEDEEQRLRYVDDVRFMDDAIGESLDLLKARGWLDDAILCAFADHGEDVGLEDGRWGHVEHVRPSLSRIPMFLMDPRERGRVDDRPVGVVDLAPTLAARLGLPRLPAWTGADLSQEFEPRPLHLESLPPESPQHWRALVRDPYKLEGRLDENGGLDGALRLFNLSKDPNCRVDLLQGERKDAPSREVLAELVEEWTRWIQSGADSNLPVDPRMEERLRALGYLD